MTNSDCTWTDIPVPKLKLFYIHPGAEEQGRIYQAALLIGTGVSKIAAAWTAMKSIGFDKA